MDSIVEALARNATEYPEKTALGFEGQNFSYTRLYRDVTRFAAGLKKWGLAPGDKVALFLENCPEFVMAYLGTHLAGGTVVLVNTQYRQVELRHILTDSEARLVVTGPGGCTELDHLKADLPGLEAMVVVGSTNQASGIPALDFEAFLAEPTAAFDFPTAKSLAIIAYTSGTTGQAKGAMLLHSNLASNIATLTTTWEWTAADRLLLVLPLFHAHGLMVGLHGTIWTGASAELRRKFEAASVLETLQQDTNLTMFFGVPTMYGRLLEGAAKLNGLPRPLRLYVSGSAPLSRETFNAFEKIFGQRILERYGMTETIMNMTNPYHGERRAGTVGAPFPGQEARIVDVQSRQPLPDGETGEIEVRGPHVFAGYLHRPEATAEAFDEDGWFKTGDLGWRSEDGYYSINGRARELIISGGYNVYPREVEEVLLQHPSVGDVAVFGLPHPDLGEQVVAAVVPAPGQPLPSTNELAEFCRHQLASFKKPRQVVLVPSLPRNALGKVQKHLLREKIGGI
ncbi:MAG: acyl-CoA synthetase [Chloroflexi bacterium]|nr:acyl-CoA synthetase [Chloroflexota bacterium]OJV97018.1 MAG: long-chain fatty acid--CoA ligase [Chloroflexi bacterium 54-19]